MIDAKDRGRSEAAPTISLARHNRIVVMLAAMCCLSTGIAIGLGIKGFSANAEDNRLTASNAATTPDALSVAFTKVAGSVEPTVVHIKVSEGDERTLMPREGAGSGVIVNPSGFILTNQHVIARAKTIKVKLLSGVEHEARIVGQDLETDLAVIRIDVREPLPAARMGDSEKLKVGDWVLAIGSPFGLEQTVTAGIISARDRVTGSPAAVFQQFLQTDAAINPGNSGGPLVNLAGEVIGINTQIATTTGVYNGIGFALPSSTAIEIYNQIIANGRVRRGFIGVQLAELKPQLTRFYGIPEGEGVLLERLTPDSPAGRAGLQAGDVILGINGQTVKSSRELAHRAAALPVGSTATVLYVRDGKRSSASVKIEERPNGDTDGTKNSSAADPAHPRATPRGPQTTPDKLQQAKQEIGLSVRTLTQERARAIGIEGASGAIVTDVDPFGLAFDRGSGAQIGDVVISINHKTIRNAEDYKRAVNELKSGEDVVVKLLRKGTGIGPRQLSSALISFTMP
ncbi:MAG: peptidase S1 [Blastocatellia bacterium AA13]|nr:MAG: peptidase S1 [Blastocatellia bacterium AA13]